MSWPYGKSIPGITVEKYLSAFVVDLENCTIGFTFAEGEKQAGQDVAYVGQWSSAGEYIADNVVYHEEKYFLCLLANGSADPKEPGETGSETYWELQDTPGSFLNACGYPYHLEQQRSITYNLSFADFVNLIGSANQGDFTDWMLILGPKAFEDTIYDAYKAASMEPLPD